LIEALEEASYPVREVEVAPRSDDVVELTATLVSTAIEPSELDAVTAALEASPLVTHASWSSTADD
jgi:putative Mg2+ transporter-C (MgtC) family protein